MQLQKFWFQVSITTCCYIFHVSMLSSTNVIVQHFRDQGSLWIFIMISMTLHCAPSVWRCYDIVLILVTVYFLKLDALFAGSSAGTIWTLHYSTSVDSQTKCVAFDYLFGLNYVFLERNNFGRSLSPVLRVFELSFQYFFKFFRLVNQTIWKSNHEL